MELRLKYVLMVVVFVVSNIIAFGKSPLTIKGNNVTSVGVYIAELSTGKVVSSYNSNVALTPASVMKAITTATAMSVVGSDYRFVTDVYAIGKIEGCLLDGNIVINGVGDPTIDSRYFPENYGFVDNIIARLKIKGITNITGSIIINQSAVKSQGVMPKWEIEDVAWDYGAGFYALNYRDNYFDLFINSMKTVPNIKGLKVENNTTLGKKDPMLLRGIGSYEIEISGTIPNRKDYSIPCSMPDPAKVMVDELINKLSQNGIVVENKNIEMNDTILLYRHKSPCSQDIMRRLMVKSDNLLAEGMLNATAPDSTRAGAINAEKKLWERRGVNCDYTVIQDGCGLARSSKISPRFIGNVLAWMAKSNMREDYLSLFPRAGENGTLRNFLKGSELSGQLALKTGSMSGVQCYAGYKLDSSELPTHVVVIMVNGFFCKRKVLIKDIERLLLEIF